MQQFVQINCPTISASGTKDSIIDVKMEDSHEEVLQQKKSPLRWLGNKWMDFLTQ